MKLDDAPTIITKHAQEAMSNITMMLSSYALTYGLMEHYKAESERLEEELANAGELVTEERVEGCKYCDIEPNTWSDDIKDTHVVTGASEAHVERRENSIWYLVSRLYSEGMTHIRIYHCPFCGRMLP